MQYQGRNNYVVISYDNAVQYAGTLKGGRAFWFNDLPRDLQGFTREAFAWNLLNGFKHNMNVQFFTYKKDMDAFIA